MGDAEILEAFKAMGPLLLTDKFVRDPGTENEPKKHKRSHPEPKPAAQEVTKLVRLMGSMILRLDAEQQLMKRQASFVFFLQTEEPALLPQLVSRANEWHAQMKQRSQTTSDPPPYVPLRLVLFQDMATLLEDRVKKLSIATPQDPLWVTATTHGVLTTEGHFPFQRWCQQQKTLILTKKEPIPMSRMLKYMEQMKHISQDQAAIQKFHALKPVDTNSSVPWILQTGMRHDEVQVLLETLLGSTVWGLIGATMKAHTQVASRQSQELQQLLGKGKGKQNNNPWKSKGKGKHTTT